MARAPVMAAGGIVVQWSEAPLIAVVRLRKRNDWVLPKGKLNNGETARAAAEREVVEETGHDVSVHDFVGTLAYDLGGRQKIVHFWQMDAAPEQTRKLMADVKAVAWLPLDKAVARLSRDHEQAFLANVGPLALEAGVARTSPVTSHAQVVAGTHSAPPPAADAPVIAKDTSASPSGRDVIVIAKPSPERRRSLLQRVWDWLRRDESEI